MFNWKTKYDSIIRLIKVGITNCYLIESNNQNILIDTGQKKQFNKLERFLKSNWSEHHAKLDYLILTHTHYDHAQNAFQIKQLFSPKIIVHQKEAEFLKSGFTILPKGTNMVTNFISSMGNKYARWIGKYDPVIADIEVNNNFKLPDATNIELIHTPGHTLGSISIIIDNEIAIVGDTLFGIMNKRILPPFADDENKLIKSWKKLLETKCNLFLPAHGRLIKRELLYKELQRMI